MKKFIMPVIVIAGFLFTSCTNTADKAEYLKLGSISFAKPDAGIWNTDPPEVLSKFYPEYREQDLTVTPATSFSTKENKGIIVISRAAGKSELSVSLEKSEKVFKKRKKKGNNLYEESYVVNGLNFRHYMLDSNVTFTRIYITDNPVKTTEALIVDFICPPDQYRILSSSFKEFILSFKYWK